MKPNVLVLGLSVGGLLIAGCSTPPPKPKPAAAPKPVAQAAPAPRVEEVKAEPAPAPAAPVTPEAQAVVERLTEPSEGGLRHEVAEAPGFPQAMASLAPSAAAPTVDQPINYNGQPPTRGLTADGLSAELVERDWTGVVLVPVNAQFAKAYTSVVRLTSIEAHPLKDGRVRVWTRVRNVSKVPVQVGVACNFVMQEKGDLASPRFYSLEIPVGDYRDVFFVSGAGTLINYTVLVRQGS